MLGCLAASCALYLVSLIQPYLNSILSSCFLLTFTFFYDAFTLAASWLFSKFNATLPNLSSFFLFFSHLLFTMMIPCRHTRKHRGRKKSLSRPKTQKAYNCNAERDTAIVGSTPTRAYGKLKKAEETVIAYNGHHHSTSHKRIESENL